MNKTLASLGSVIVLMSSATQAFSAGGGFIGDGSGSIIGRPMRVLQNIDKRILLRSVSTDGEENDIHNNTICGITGISADKISTAEDGTNPLHTKQDFLSEGAKVKTCDYNDWIAIVAELKNGSKEVLIFEK